MGTVTDRDLGFNQILRNLRELDGKTVKAGILKNAGKEPNGTSLVDVAIYNEFGTSRIPSRPFLRIATDKHKTTWLNESERIVDKVLAKYNPNFSILGNEMVENIRDVIGNKSLLAPNAPSTIRKKGHDKPLIDKGKLKSSIAYEVE